MGKVSAKACFFRGSQIRNKDRTDERIVYPKMLASGEPVCLSCDKPWSAHYGSWNPPKVQ